MSEKLTDIYILLKSFLITFYAVLNIIFNTLTSKNIHTEKVVYAVKKIQVVVITILGRQSVGLDHVCMNFGLLVLQLNTLSYNKCTMIMIYMYLTQLVYHLKASSHLIHVGESPDTAQNKND